MIEYNYRYLTLSIRYDKNLLEFNLVIYSVSNGVGKIKGMGQSSKAQITRMN